MLLLPPPPPPLLLLLLTASTVQLTLTSDADSGIDGPADVTSDATPWRFAILLSFVCRLARRDDDDDDDDVDDGSDGAVPECLVCLPAACRCAPLRF